MYPAAQVEITVHDPWPWSGSIDGAGNGMQTILQALGQLRGQDQADPDVYYYAAFDPTASFGTFCGGGCTTGLSNIGAPTSVGIGYGGGPAEGYRDRTRSATRTASNMRAGCGAGGPDKTFPYAMEASAFGVTTRSRSR